MLLAGYPAARAGWYAVRSGRADMNALMTLHVTQRAGHNAHHVAEACFKAVARALRHATEPDPRAAGVIPSTQGSL